MTELQFLIKVLTTQKLSATLKDMFIERIGEVEGKLSSQPAPIVRPAVTAQAPSMQRIMEQTAHETIELAQQISQPGRTVALPPKPVAIDKETGRAMVQTGKGTMGPRKF